MIKCRGPGGQPCSLPMLARSNQSSFVFTCIQFVQSVPHLVRHHPRLHQGQPENCLLCHSILPPSDLVACRSADGRFTPCSHQHPSHPSSSLFKVIDSMTIAGTVMSADHGAESCSPSVSVHVCFRATFWSATLLDNPQVVRSANHRLFRVKKKGYSNCWGLCKRWS